MISLIAAQQLVLEQARSFGKEIILLEESTGRVLNESLIADRDYPPFNRATMDGIAINSEDWHNGVRSFIPVETIFAGTTAKAPINKGECFRIMTGAAVPVDADTVIRKEDTATSEHGIAIAIDEIKSGQNIAAKGTDIKKDTAIISTPQLIKPGTITSLASLGYAEVKVAALPTVAIITTGDEVVPVDGPVSEVQIRNSNASLLNALLQGWQIKPVYCRHLSDDAELLLNAVKQQLHNNVLIISGAVSAGDADFVPDVLIKAGVKNIFHKVAIRPGKPIWFGKIENGTTVFALPGNPFSTFVTFKLFIEPFLAASFGLPKSTPIQIPFSGSRIKKTNLDEFFPVKLSGTPTTASAMPFNSSGDITAMMNADALARQPFDKPEIKDGEYVDCMIV